MKIQEPYFFPMQFENMVREVTKLTNETFPQEYLRQISQMRFCGKTLRFPNTVWRSKLLGFGEEKAV